MRLGLLIWTAVLWTCAGCGGEGPSPEKQAPPVKPVPGTNPSPKPEEGPWFVCEAQERGVTMLNETGRPGRKEFIMSAVGPGTAWFDANGDGLMDLYVPNGNWLEGPQRDRFYTGEDRPRNALYIQQPDHTFVNEARQRGVDHDGWAFGACAADLDNDGDQDLVVTNLSFNCLFVNDGTGKFTDIAAKAGIAGRKVDWSTGIAIADYDKDGLLDLYIANYADMFEWMRVNKEIERHPDGSIRNAAICVWQSIKVYCGPQGLPGQQDHLYRNRGGRDTALRFEDVTKATGVFRPKDEGGPLYGFQALFTDLNGDGWLDIYIANDSVPSFFLESQEGKRFSELANEYNIALGDMGDDMAGMGADSADINGDGYMDVHKTNFAAQTNNLYVAEPYEGRVAFRDYSTQVGIKEVVFADLSWAVLVFDFDNDGDRDIFYANGHVYPEVDRPEAAKLNMSFEQVNQMFRNESKGERLRFVKVTERMGPGFAIQKCSRGAALADFDNDGDLDIAIVNLNAPPDLLVNRRGNRSGHWLLLRLVGNVEKKSPLEAIGSKLWVEAGGLRQFFEIKRGQGFLGCHDPRQHVGLGSREGPVEVEVTWPNGDKSTHRIETVDRVVEIRQP